jgi:hypothetical protein
VKRFLHRPKGSQGQEMLNVERSRLFQCHRSDERAEWQEAFYNAHRAWTLDALIEELRRGVRQPSVGSLAQDRLSGKPGPGIRPARGSAYSPAEALSWS